MPGMLCVILKIFSITLKCFSFNLFLFINFHNKLHLFFNSFHNITQNIVTYKKARIHSGLIYYVNFEIISELEEGAKLDFY